MALTRSYTVLAALLLAVVSARSPSSIQRTDPTVIDSRYDAVVLVADVRSGLMLDGRRSDRAFERAHMPASLFKLAIALSSLSSGRRGATFTYTCRGTDTLGGTAVTCWRHDGHGKLDFQSAIAQSCNLYFHRLAEPLSNEEITRAARALGMIGASGFPNDPTPSAAPPLLRRETLLGEAFPVSPAQMLRTALVLASRGRLAMPPINLVGPRFTSLYDGLRHCVYDGTGRGAWTSNFSVAGKTGTAPVAGTKNRTVGWFIGYAPADHPRYALSILLHNGKGSDAAIVARKVLEELM